MLCASGHCPCILDLRLSRAGRCRRGRCTVCLWFAARVTAWCVTDTICTTKRTSSFPRARSQSRRRTTNWRDTCAPRSLVRSSLLDSPLLPLAAIDRSRTHVHLARCRYYLGRIKSIQLDYTEALRNLQQALRKAPQSSATGFRITVHPRTNMSATASAVLFDAHHSSTH